MTVEAFAGMQRNSPTKQEVPASTSSSPVGFALRGLTRVSARWPRFILALVILVCCSCGGYTFFFLKLETDRADLIDPKAEFHKRWTHYAKTFGDASDVIVVAEARTIDEIKRVLDDVAARLKREPELYSNILYKFEAGPLQRKWVQYARPWQLQVGLRRINQLAPVLRGDWTPVELDRVITRVGDEIDGRMAALNESTAPSATDMKRIFRHADLLAGSLAHYMSNRDDFHSPWPDVVPVDPQIRGLNEELVYFLNERGTMGFLRVVLRNDSKAPGAPDPLAHLADINREVIEAHPGAQIGLTGLPALERDDMCHSQHDMAYATAAAAVGCLLLLIVGLRGIRHPLLALLMLAAGLTWSLGFATEMVGHLNIVSMTVVAVLFGLGIDFGIVFTARYLQLRHAGWQLRAALMETTGSTGGASVTAALTASLAFLCTLLTDFAGVAELGLIAAAGIMLCALSAYLVLPALIALADRDVDPSRLPHPFEGDLLRRTIMRFPLVTFGVSAVVLLAVGSQLFRLENGRIATRVRFDYNLMNLQAADAESVRLERRLFEEASQSILFAVSIADSERQMRELQARLSELPTVRHVESIAMRLPNVPTDATRQLVAQFRSQLANLPAKVPALRNADPADVGKAIENFYTRVKRYGSDPFAGRVVSTIDTFLNGFEKLSLAEQTQFLNEFQYRSAADLLWQLQTLRYGAADEQIRPSDLPGELISRYVTPADAAGKQQWLLQIYPKERIWDEAPLARFIGELRSVDPNVTGAPVQNYEMASQLKHSYEIASLYAFAAVWIILLIDFLSRQARWLALLPPLFVTVLAAVMLQARHIKVDPMLFAIAYVAMTAAIAIVLDARNLRNALLAYVPAIAGALMAFGIMGFFHVDLNPANLIVLPLLLGIGVNNGIQIMHDFEKQKGPYRMSGSVFSTVVLTATTSIVGFGSMMIASHRGIFSLGLAMAIGVSCCLFVALVFVPSLLGLLATRDGAVSSAPSRSENGGARRSETKARAA